MNAQSVPARCLALILAMTLVAPPVFAAPQKAANPGPHRIFAPYFRVGDGYSSTIFVRNRHLRTPASVTPIVNTMDGTEVRLPTVQIAANSARAISIEDELRAANTWVGSGALTLEYVAANPTVVNAQIFVKNPALGIIFDLPLQPGIRSTSGPSSTLTAPWWYREAHVSGQLVLFNTSAAAITVHSSLAVDQQQRKAGDFALAPHQYRNVGLKELLQSAGSALVSEGMLSLSYDGSAGALYAALLFFNEQNGYSLTTQFTSPEVHHGDGSDMPALYYLPGVSVNQQDPAMGFRKDLRFTPYAVLGNTTQKPMAVTLKASFDVMDGTGLQHADLPLPPLAPLETRVLDFSQYLNSKVLPASIMDFTLELLHPGMMGDLVFQVFSVDQSGNFVFGAEARANASFRDDFNYWSTEGNNDTMLSIHNVSDEDLPVIVTIGFNEGKGSYRFAPLTVPRGATVGVDLKVMIAQASKPDDKGNAIPKGATFGTLRVETADGQPVERFQATASIYDPVSGTCGGGCKICNIADGLGLANDPLIGAVSTTQQVTATVQWDDGTFTDATLSTRFSSSASSIISVTSTPGVSGSGTATFSTVGTATITGSFTFSGGTPSEPPPVCATSCPTVILTGPTPGNAFAGVLTPQDNFSGRSTSRFDIAEVINLSFNAQVTAAALGGLQWSIVSGGGSLPDAGTAGTGTYTAPATAATVVLRLAVVSGSSQGQKKDYTLTIVTPSGGLESKSSNIRHTHGFESVGFQGRIFLQPTDVSFANLQFAEGTTTATASGFFAAFNGQVHPASASPKGIGSCDSVIGCQVLGAVDQVDSGNNPPPFSVGDFLWPIPWQYELSSGGSLITFTTANHHETADATGTGTIAKAGAGPFSKNASDPTTTY